MKIQYVTGIHGDEPIPPITLAVLKIDQVIANPKALSLNKRFVDMDMNKAFDNPIDNYETRIAKDLPIKPNTPIIDLHTTSAKTEPFAIIVDMNMLGLAQKLPVKHIVLMKFNIKNGHSLIDKYPGVSVECGQHMSIKSMKFIANLVRFDSQKQKPKLLEVFDTINTPGEYINLKDNGDFIPVLAGERAYSFIGLKARQVTI